jgi:hypothetical protein
MKAAKRGSRQLPLVRLTVVAFIVNEATAGSAVERVLMKDAPISDTTLPDLPNAVAGVNMIERLIWPKLRLTPFAPGFVTHRER